jgi:hypothetical protein
MLNMTQKKNRKHNTIMTTLTRQHTDSLLIKIETSISISCSLCAILLCHYYITIVVEYIS